MAMQQPDNKVVWPGTTAEHALWTDVMVRLMKDCACSPMDVEMPVQCVVHVAGTSDQQWLNRLVYVRRRLAMSVPGARNRTDQ